MERLALRFGLDRVHAARVRRTAQELFHLVAAPWGLDGDSSLRRMLGWAADLHELGLAVSHAGYHKHGAYLLQHGDLGGFSTADQEALAALVLSHRGRLDPERIGAIHRGPLDPILRTAVLLRLAYRIHRSRALRQPVVRVAEVGPSTVTLLFGAYFFDNHPLTRAELTEEAAVLQRVGLKLTVVEAGPEATPPAGPSAPPGR